MVSSARNIGRDFYPGAPHFDISAMGQTHRIDFDGGGVSGDYEFGQPPAGNDFYRGIRVGGIDHGRNHRVVASANIREVSLANFFICSASTGVSLRSWADSKYR